MDELPLLKWRRAHCLPVHHLVERVAHVGLGAFAPPRRKRVPREFAVRLAPGGQAMVPARRRSADTAADARQV